MVTGGRRPFGALGNIAPTMLCAGCSGWQSALEPHGPQASDLHRLFWLFVVVAVIVWLLVMAVLAGAILRPRRETPASRGGSERRATILVAGASVATVLVLIGLAVASYRFTPGLNGAGNDAIVIRVRGYQWWWEVTYVGTTPDREFTTANEIHVPVGRPVTIQLAAVDVIHSFWVPNLAGKQDLIPGRDTQLELTAAQAGRYRGQCAEFCGLQHAHMTLLVVAQPPDEFEAWRAAQLAEAMPPSDAEQDAGARIVASKACVGCHEIRGTVAAGKLGPDLTHVASRSFIAAGLLPTTRGSLAAWIADPQTIKPGNNMPMVPLASDELRAVSAYLAALR
jgi:cytochrome c oxidase subunit 2